MHEGPDDTAELIAPRGANRSPPSALLGLFDNEELFQQRPESQAALDWTTAAHTGAPTVVTAEGAGSKGLIGNYPNTHLHEVMRELLVG
jgi:alkaline phosphatase